MKIKTLFLFLLPFICYSQLTEQQIRAMAKTASEPELIIENSSLILEKKLYHAGIIVDRLLEINPNSANYNYRKGLILLTSDHDYTQAMKYFLKALPLADKDYDFFSITDTTCSTEIYYHLANCYHLDGQLDKAKEYYTIVSNFNDKTSEIVTNANLKLTQCNVAKKLIDNAKKTKIKNLGTTINSKYPEYSPIISLDGQALYFTSKRPWSNGETNKFRDDLLNEYPEDIYVSYKDQKNNGAWTNPIKLDFCQPERNEATITVSSDETRIYVYQDISGGGDIFYSDFKTNSFQEIQALSYKDVNTKYWETHCTMTIDGLNMYFVSDRPGGFGGRDIYRIVKLPDGSWSEPKNLGPTINTAFDEDSPFIGSDNKTLYYSSNGPESMGGFDILLSIRDENNTWSNPVNLGYPINSFNDDVFYTTTIDGKYGYFTSFRKDGNGEKDIYEIENDELGSKNIATLKGVIKTAYNKPLPKDITISLKCTDCDVSEEKILQPRLVDGSFFSPLETSKVYELTYKVNKNKKVLLKESFVTSLDEGYEEEYKEMLLDVDNMKFIPLADTVGKTYEVYIAKELMKNNVINNASEKVKVNLGTDLATLININPIYFDLNKFDIRKDAKVELDKIIKIMNENPKMVIKLGSHTDCRGSSNYNMLLSDNRAKASAAYIKSKITNPKRVSGKGYGETQLINKCECEGKVESQCTEEEHQLNRRTEFIIVKME